MNTYTKYIKYDKLCCRFMAKPGGDYEGRVILRVLYVVFSVEGWSEDYC